MIRVLICRLFNCSDPGFYCHEFISLVEDFNEFLLFGWLLFWLDSFSRQINILIEVFESVRFLLSFFLYLFASIEYFPDNYCAVLTTAAYHIIIRKSNFSHVRAVPNIRLMLLLRNVARIFKETYALVIVSNC